MKARDPLAIGFLCALLAAAPARAIDDRFDPSKYDRGGFAPAQSKEYAKECGSCHFAYLPGLLPERSWRALMARTEEHFGEALALAPEVARSLEAYLAANAADRSGFRGSELILYRLPDSAVPTRITALPVMRQRHVVVTKLIAAPVPTMTVKGLTNCDGCHERAAAGSFAYREIVVPGVTKVIGPNSLF